MARTKRSLDTAEDAFEQRKFLPERVRGQSKALGFTWSRYIEVLKEYCMADRVSDVILVPLTVHTCMDGRLVYSIKL